MAYIYETHLHTSQGSKCGRSPGRDFVQQYIDAGYTGVIVTDHFFHGNCCVDRNLPWREFVNRFCAGYEDARNEGEKRGLSVFFGWEENFKGDEYLVYGLDKEWLLGHPEMIHWTRKQQHDAVRASGGCVVQAHPFRAVSYLHTIYLSPSFADAVEGVNAGNEPQWNSLALRYASIVGLPVTAGSDNHLADATRPEKLAGVAFDRPLFSIHDYVSAILDKKRMDLHLSCPVPEWTPSITPELPCKWLDEEGNPLDVNVQRILEDARAVPKRSL